MGANDLIRSLDEGLSAMLASWNSYSTGLATMLIGIVVYRVATMRDADVHPLLLARQAEHNRIRMPRESPVYSARYTERPTTGLNVRDDDGKGQRRSVWARGKDGDLRDVWRQAFLGAEPPGTVLRGPVEGAGDVPRKRGKLLSVFGRRVVEHSIDGVNHQIVTIGRHLASQGAARVAIYLPNSVELTAALFACCFRLLSPVLISFEQPPFKLAAMLRESGADTIFTAPGAFPLDSVAAECPGLRRVIWVVDEGNKHLDWNEIPGSVDGRVGVATWQDIIRNAGPADPEGEKPVVKRDEVPGAVVMFWQRKNSLGELEEDMVEFAHAQLVAGIAGQIEALPGMGPADTFLPADSLASAHTLVVTLAALFSNASVAFNSAACLSPDLAAITSPAVLCPTVLVATPATLLKAHTDYASRLRSSIASRLTHWSKTRTLLREGRLPAGKGPRLVIAADHAGSGTTPVLSPAVLSDLRAALGARIVYAMAAPRVAGAVAQTMAFDYRSPEGEAEAHFGGPPRCLTFVLRDTKDVKNSDEKYQGEIFVSGPCVVGGETGLGVIGTVRPDNTLAYA